MKRAVAVLACLASLALPLEAQRLSVVVRAGYSLADYREQAAFLHFRGSGPTAMLSLERGRISLRADVTHLSLDPVNDGLEPFTADQYAVRVGVKPLSLIAIEAGFMRRSTAPSRAAQSYSAGTLGVRAAYPLAPGSDVAIRAAYVAGGDFTGGGSAPLGVELGLAAAYGPGSGRFRLTGEFDFHRIDRRTDQNGSRLSVPIQSSVAGFGVEVRF